MKTNELTLPEKSLKSRFLSFLLAVMVMFMCIPSQNLTFISASAESTVATSMNVEFTDKKYTPLLEDSVQSGEMFYLLLTLGGANVNENTSTEKFHVEISDPYLLLPNFAGNGLVDGATWNGFTLQVRSDGTRYIEYDAKNGSTGVIQMQAKFANGITPNGYNSMVTLVNDSTGDEVSGIVKATSSIIWNSSKYVDKSKIDGSDINSGVVLNYTLSASPSNSSKSKGVSWAESVTFTDTITLPSGMTFESGAEESIEDAIKNAITNGGYVLADDFVNVFVSGNTATITFTLKNPNNNIAEMNSINLNFPLTLNDNNVNLENMTTSGDIQNKLDVVVTPMNTRDSEVSAGSTTVKTTVTVPEPKFEITKTVNNKKDTYFSGDEVTFTITAKNIGGKNGTITITDVIPNGLSYVSNTENGSYNNNTVTWANVPIVQNGTFTVEVTCKVDNVNSDTYINNTATGTWDKGSVSSSANITVKPKFEITKSGTIAGDSQHYLYTKDESGNYYPITDKKNVEYTITIKNNTDTQQTVTLKDVIDGNINDINQIKITDVNNQIETRNISNNQISEEITISANSSVNVTINGTLSLIPTNLANITNKAEITCDGKTYTSNEVVFYPKENKAELNITKTTDKSQYTPGGDVTYTITITNNGSAEATGVTIDDTNIKNTALFSNYTITSATNNGTKIENFELGKTPVNIESGKSVIVKITATVASDFTGNISNTANYKSNNAGTGDSNTVTLSKDTSGDYQVEKWTVDANGNRDDDLLVSQGDYVTFRAKFTNKSGKNIQNLYLTDYNKEYNTTINGEAIENDLSNVIKVKIVSNSGDNSTMSNYDDYKYKVNTEITPNLKYTSEWCEEWYIDLENINLPNNGYIEFEYTLYLGGGNADSTINNIGYVMNKVLFSITGRNTNNVNEYETKNQLDKSILTINKTCTENNVNIADLTKEELLDKTFTYNLIIGGTSNQYTGKTITITDVIPKGFTYDGSSWENSIGEISNATLKNVVATDNKDGTTTLNIEVISNVALDYDYNNYNRIIIPYNLKLTSTKVDDLMKLSNTEDLTNKVTNVTVTDTDDTVLKNKNTNATATVTFKNVQPAPGFAKLAVKSFAGKEYDPNDAELLQPVNDGLITAGDTLIWHAVVYNGDGKYDTNETASLEFKGEIVDILPNTYKYDTETGYPVSIKICDIKDYNQDGIYEYDFSQGNPVNNAPTATRNENNEVSWKFSNNPVTLKPNQCLVIEFSTVATEDLDGVITNRGYADFGKSYTTEQVVAGEPQDTTIWNYANYNIVGLTTESWKTITYTNQGHDGTPHKDPETDTGYSRVPTHNYVQGMQGEDVTYTLNIKNTSALSLENFVVIDRLPYVNDKGLVSGYARNSAFPVTFKNIESVKIVKLDSNGNWSSDVATLNEGYNTNGYTISYSTDKTSVLTDSCKDWLGQNDIMSWTSDPTNAINFRIKLSSDVTIGKQETVQITFKGTVPSYVANTGEDNIAWNSFAYAYQNSRILGTKLMVAEPAKVGVWVLEPDDTIDITINKTSDSSGTFYFALFTKSSNDTYERVSDVVSLDLIKPTDANATGSTTIKSVDLKSIKALKGNQADYVYVLETDKNGNRLTDENGTELSGSKYDVTYAGNTISTDVETNQTVDVTNTKQVGSIAVEKTVTYLNANTSDTFYFALFTKDDNNNNYVRYEDIPVKSLTLTATDNNRGIVQFNDVPINTTFYVLETNSNGVLVDDNTSNYTGSALGKKYSVNSSSSGITLQSADSSQNCTITNNEQQNYMITVSKSLISDSINTNPSFYVGLYTSDTATNASDVKQITANSDEVTFEYLNNNTKYYIFECDKDGKKITDNKITQNVYLTNEDTNTTSVEFTVKYNYDTATGITLNADNPNSSVVVTNLDGSQDKITVKKTFLANTSSDITTDDITIGLFAYDTDGTLKQVGQSKTISSSEFKNNVAEITFENLTTDKYYYVFELNGDTKLSNGDNITIGNNHYTVEYSNSNQVYVDGIRPITVDITNTKTDNVEYTFKKVDVNGNNFSGATLTITKQGDDTFTPITWTTIDTTDNKPYNKVLTSNELPDGTYTLTETSITGYDTINGTFEIKDGAIIDCKIANATYTANSLTITNKSVVDVSKQKIGGSAEIKGALITIKTKDDNTLIKTSQVELSRTGTIFTNANVSLKYDDTDTSKIVGLQLNNADITENYTTYYYKDAHTLIFYSGDSQTSIKGLPDGDYIMTETIAPDGYELLTTSFEFNISSGQLNSSHVNDDKYSYTYAGGNSITMFDKPKSSIASISIGKVDLIGEEIEGATITLSGKNGDTSVSLENVQISDNFIQNTDGILSIGEYELSNDYATLTWVSQSNDNVDDSMVLTGLPDGTYTLEETSAPTGYEVTTKVTFTIETGIVTITSGAYQSNALVSGDDAPNENYYVTDNDSVNIILVDKAKPSEVTISKVKITGDTCTELSGATLRITSIDNPTKDLSNVTATQNGGTANGFSRDGTSSIEFISGTDETLIKGLPAGNYKLEETTTPSGYQTAETITFKLNADGTVFDVENSNSTDEEIANNKIVMLDKVKGQVSISKLDATNKSKEVKGAKLEVTLNSGTLSSDITLTRGETTLTKDTDYTINGNTIKFTSSTEPTLINGLNDGKYTLKETNAPSGYLITNEVTFTIQNGQVIDGTTTIEDTPISVNISKKAITEGGDELKGAELKITAKSDNVDLSNVYSDNNKIYVDKDNKTITFTSTDKVTLIKGLPAGSYQLEETTAPNGYEKAESIDFTINDNGTIDNTNDNTIVMVDKVKSVVNISKIKITNGTSSELSGATLKITNEDTNFDLSKVTATQNSGTAKDFVAKGNSISFTSVENYSTIITGLPAGDYKLEEITAPSGYQKAETITFTLNDDGTISNVKNAHESSSGNTIVMLDEEETEETTTTTTITKTKTTISKTDITGTKELEGALLQITSNDELSLSTVTSSNNDILISDYGKVLTFTSKDTPTELSGLQSGTYTLTEITAPKGYTIAESIVFTVSSDKTIVNNVTMKDSLTEVNISKVAIVGDEVTELANAKLTIESVGAENDLTEVTATQNGETAKDFVAKENSISFTSVENFETVINGLPSGTYTLTEVTAPDGYEIAETIEFTLNDDGTITNVKNSNSTNEDISNNKIVMLDKVKSIVNISKVAIVGDEVTELANAKLTIESIGTEKNDLTEVAATQNGETAKDFVAKENSISFTSVENFETVITGLPSGTYTLTEVTAPNGYEIAETIEFTLNDDGTITNVKNSNSTNEDISNNKIVMLDIQKPTVSISKKDASNGSEIVGAELVITSKDKLNVEDITLTRVQNDEVITLENGKDYIIDNDKNTITFTSAEVPTLVNGLKDGSYTLTETIAPSGYVLSTDKVEFTIEKGVVTGDTYITNDLTTTTISKTDITGDKELEGAELTITSKNGDIDLSKVTSTNNDIKISENGKTIQFTSKDEKTILKGMPSGEYTLTETSAPNGYTINQETVTFTVTQDGKTSTATMKDDVISVTISKVDITNQSELAGAELTITNLSGESLNNVVATRGGSVIDITNNGTSISFTSGNSSTVLTQLPTGDYQFKEVTAPEGYEIAESIFFRIDELGQVFIYENYGESNQKANLKDDKLIVMQDEKTTEDTTTTITTDITTTSETSSKVTTVPVTTTTNKDGLNSGGLDTGNTNNSFTQDVDFDKTTTTPVTTETTVTKVTTTSNTDVTTINTTVPTDTTDVTTISTTVPTDTTDVTTISTTVPTDTTETTNDTGINSDSITSIATDITHGSEDTNNITEITTIPTDETTIETDITSDSETTIDTTTEVTTILTDETTIDTDITSDSETTIDTITEVTTILTDETTIDTDITSDSETTIDTTTEVTTISTTVPTDETTTTVSTTVPTDETTTTVSTTVPTDETTTVTVSTTVPTDETTTVTVSTTVPTDETTTVSTTVPTDETTTTAKTTNSTDETTTTAKTTNSTDETTTTTAKTTTPTDETTTTTAKTTTPTDETTTTTAKTTNSTDETTTTTAKTTNSTDETTTTTTKTTTPTDETTTTTTKTTTPTDETTTTTAKTTTPTDETTTTVNTTTSKVTTMTTTSKTDKTSTPSTSDEGINLALVTMMIALSTMAVVTKKHED